MTRINTNVSSLMAQKTLSRSNDSLQQALTRLSTGLRINSGKDDPAGLIASEALRSDMISVKGAIKNSQRANQMIATADSALGEVSALLNDIRGLVTEAANEGVLSDDQIAANQLQIDASLGAINRIAQMTSFQGRNLVDGSLDFLTTAGTVSTIEDIQIDQAAIGSSGQVAVDVDIATAAAKAAITNDGFTAAAAAAATVDFAMSAELTNTAVDGALVITSKSLTDTTAYVVTLADGGDGTAAVATYDGGTAITVTGDFDDTNSNGNFASTGDIVNAINNSTDNNLNSLVSAVVSTGLSTVAWAVADDAKTATEAASSLTLTAADSGAAYNNVAVSFETSASVPIGTPTASFDSTLNTVTITVHDDDITDLSTIAALFGVGTDVTEFTAAAGGTGSASINGAEADVDATGNTGTSGGALLLDDLVVQVKGNTGMEVFSFESGTGANMVASAINLVGDATGVSAAASGNTLTFNSTEYGTNAYVDIDVISEGSSGTFTGNLSATRDTGEDIDATINGITVNGDGNEMSINTATLAMTVLVSDGSSTNFDFNITGGGALFQLGPDVVTNQQARLGIQSVNTAVLRGSAGRLYELGDGKAASLATDTTTAANIVDQVMAKVTSLRGRLGAFQKTTLETNIRSLNDTLENLTDAESSIRDADFAAESAALTRAQILVQSGISVLGIANSNPQNVLALLR